MPEQNPILDALQVSVIVDRRDRAGQIPWTEWRTGIAYGCPANPGDLVGLNASGKIDACLLPTTSSNVFVNGTPVTNPDFNNTTPAAPVGFTNVIWQTDGTNVSAYYATSGMVVSFGQITSGTNTTAAMVVGSGASLTVACPGTGVIEATELATDNCTPVVTNISHPTHPGQLLISQPDNASAVWADPEIIGLYPEGTPVDGPLPPFAPPTTIQPVLIGGRDQAGLLRDIQVTDSGAVVTVDEDQAYDAQHFAWDTGPDPRLIPVGQLTPLLSIRPQAAATVTFFLTGLDILMMPAMGEFQLIKNATLTGATFANVPNSNAQQDTSATAVSGGTRVDSGYTQNGTRVIRYDLDFDAVTDTYTLACQRQTGLVKQYANGALRWSEQTQPL